MSEQNGQRLPVAYPVMQVGTTERGIMITTIFSEWRSEQVLIPTEIADLAVVQWLQSRSDDMYTAIIERAWKQRQEEKTIQLAINDPTLLRKVD